MQKVRLKEANESCFVQRKGFQISIGVLLPRTKSVLPSPTPYLLIKSLCDEATASMKLPVHAESCKHVVMGEVLCEVPMDKVTDDN